MLISYQYEQVTNDRRSSKINGRFRSNAAKVGARRQASAGSAHPWRAKALYRKRGLKKLLERIIEGSVGRLVLTHKDRLLRFGAELIFALCEEKNVEVVLINQGDEPSFEEELAQDVLEIITVFSARLYGSRSRKNKRLLDDLKGAVENARA